MASKVLEATFPPGRLEEFESLFFSKEDRVRGGQEAGAESEESIEGAVPTWKHKVTAKLKQMADVSGVKDAELLADLQHRLAMRDLDFERTRFSGWCTIGEDGSAKIDLVVRCKQPSFVYRVLFDDHVDVPIRIHCSEQSQGAVLRTEIPYRKAVDTLGCLVTVILFAAFIVPGIVWLYVTRSARGVWDVVHEQVVFPALQERLARGAS